MIVEEVEIKNFRSHKASTIKFDQGISVIVGDNGSGKTSILDAINFALFKKPPNKEIKVDDLIRRGSSEAQINLKFYANGRNFKITRGRKVGRAFGSALYERKDGEEILIVAGEDETTQEAEKILKVNGELFTSAIYIKQGEIDSLLSATPSKRKEHVGRLLGAEDLERAYKNMIEITKGYESKIREFGNIEEEIEKITGEIEEEKEEISRFDKEINEISEGLAIKKESLDKVAKKLEELEACRELEGKREANYRELKNLEEMVGKIEDYEDTLKKTERVHERFVTLEKEIGKLKEEKSEYSRYIERKEQLNKELTLQTQRSNEVKKAFQEGIEKSSSILKMRIGTYEELEKAYNENITKIKKRLEDINREKEKIGSEIGKVKGRNEGIQKAINDLESAKDKCPTCGAKLTKEHKNKLLKEYSHEIEENNEKISINEKKLEVVIEDEEKTDETLQKIQGINLEVMRSYLERTDEIEENIKKIKEQLEESREKLKGTEVLDKELKEKENERSSIERDNEGYIGAREYLRKYLPEKEELQEKINALRKEAEDIEVKIKSAIKKIGYLPEINEEIARVRKEIRLRQDEVTTLEKGKSGKESLIVKGREIISKLEGRIEGLKKDVKELEKLSTFLTFLEKIRALFHKDHLQKDLRVRAKPLVERYTREVFDDFNLPYSDIGVTEDFNIVVYGPQGEESADMLSGGERIASALALRIGIAKALSGAVMEMIILDEPTIHLDATRRQELVEIIRRLSSIPQTIVVTHDKEFEHAADRLIVVEKKDGISRVREGD